MLLVLADATDPVASAVAQAADGYRWLTPAQLQQAGVLHRVGPTGARTQLDLAGRTLDLADFRGVLNRLRWLPPGSFRDDADREYAAMERHALMTSVLQALSVPVINRPSPPSLAGPLRSELEWLRLAARVGIRTRGVRVSSNARQSAWGTRPEDGWVAYDWTRMLRREPSGQPDGDGSLPASVPAGRRPVVWLAPIGRPRRCWVVGESVIGSHLERDPDPVPLARAVGCQLLEVTFADDPFGAGCLVEVEPFPARTPRAVSLAIAGLLSSERVSPR